MKSKILLVGLVASIGCSGSSSTSPAIAPVAPAAVVPAAPAAAVVATTSIAAAAPQMSPLAEAGIVPEWLDRTADPCDDFFAYSCGGFVKTAEIPGDHASWGAVSLVIQRNEEFLRGVLEAAAKDAGADEGKRKLGDYYAACTDEPAIEKAGAAPLGPLLDVVAKVADAKSAAAAIVELHALGFSPYFDLGPSQDFADATKVIAGFDQAGLGLPDRDYYLKSDGNRKAIRATYLAHVERMFALLGKNAVDAKAAAADVMRVETGIAKASQDEVIRRDPHAVYHRVERKGLEKLAPQFPWGDLLARLNIGTVTEISVNDPKYFTAIAKMIANEPASSMRNYLTWKVLQGSAANLSHAFVDEQFTMSKALAGVKEVPARWRRCVSRVDRDLGELLGQTYVASLFSKNAKDQAIELTKSVLATMAAEVAALPWMDDAAKKASQTKLDKMEYLVGYPDVWRKYTFPISRTDFFANVRAAGSAERARQYAKIGKPVDRKDWGMSAPTVNAYYDPSLNLIALPAGQLQAPFFGEKFHPAVNFGSTGGGTIGHEMTHGFDDEGSQFDANGNLRDWWSKSTKAQFTKATQCVVKQYDGYEAVKGVKLNGKLTAGENIADILAYQGWKQKQATPPAATVEGFTDEQLYFLAYGQSWCEKTRPEALETQAHTNPHSPAEWRVKGVIIDQPGFAKAFSCKEKTKMNPGNACQVW